MKTSFVLFLVATVVSFNMAFAVQGNEKCRKGKQTVLADDCKCGGGGS